MKQKKQPALVANEVQAAFSCSKYRRHCFGRLHGVAPPYPRRTAARCPSIRTFKSSLHPEKQGAGCFFV
ncbi:hypothetical protein HMPREF9098_2329 [Kingella denitrificans ATCC 33394]|uniref:Uncharacterized protein n=1 Tax=Kingella denitrificans ATCC 33394 TaxID=888741 RepID=F0F2J4_9NEIS|nr:hypothetical protein HMPREF9098_2329 [Kingella denitrificans ATCC 33394]